MSAFDWHDYITIREEDPLAKAKLEVIIGRIANTPEGQELIKKAKEVSGGGQYNIELGTSMDNFTLGGEPMAHRIGAKPFGLGEVYPNKDGQFEGKLTVNLASTGTVGYNAPDGKPVVVSATNIMVHELFHLADPNRLPHVRRARYTEALREQLAPMLHIEGADEPTKQRVLAAASDSVIERFGLTLDFEGSKVFTPEVMQRLQTAAGEHKVTFQPSPEPLPPGKGFTKLFGSVVGEDHYPGEKPSAHGQVRYEEQAVDYTDRFMKKYFGEAERQGYGNLFPMQVAAPKEPELLAKPTPDAQLPRYEPEQPPPGIGNLPSPLTLGSQGASVLRR